MVVVVVTSVVYPELLWEDALMEYPYAEEGVWFDLPKEWHVACCDCGLIHVMEFRVNKETALFEVRVKRDNRATAQRRRHMKKKLVNK